MLWARKHQAFICGFCLAQDLRGGYLKCTWAVTVHSVDDFMITRARGAISLCKFALLCSGLITLVENRTLTMW